ncbi:hypothetical protein T05_8563 [Trichinella murrelli]|uniref:Uncharacterized protein n=1 Tax=Trichinella murrelli TaxID=144512 RepID=A0A0V0TDF8_9BILA|nr:hypothetical protein T05_8563 [Trichinella murrelli]
MDMEFGKIDQHLLLAGWSMLDREVKGSDELAEFQRHFNALLADQDRIALYRAHDCVNMHSPIYNLEIQANQLKQRRFTSFCLLFFAMADVSASKPFQFPTETSEIKLNCKQWEQFDV